MDNLPRRAGFPTTCLAGAALGLLSVAGREPPGSLTRVYRWRASHGEGLPLNKCVREGLTDNVSKSIWDKSRPFWDMPRRALEQQEDEPMKKLAAFIKASRVDVAAMTAGKGEPIKAAEANEIALALSCRSRVAAFLGL